MIDEIWNLSYQYGQYGLYEKNLHLLSFCRQAKWRHTVASSEKVPEKFRASHGVLICLTHGRHGLVFRPRMNHDDHARNGRPDLVRPLQVRLAHWIRQNGGRSSGFRFDAQQFCLEHGFGALPEQWFDGHSLELPVAIFLIEKELGLHISLNWGATGQLQLSGNNLLIGNVSMLEVKVQSFFREFPECHILLPKSGESTRLQSLYPGRVFPVETFTEAAKLVFGENALEQQIRSMEHQNPITVWKNLCNNYSAYHSDPEKAMIQWEILETSRRRSLHESEKNYRAAAYVLYASHLGQNLNRVGADIANAVEYFKESNRELSEQIEGLQLIARKLDAELDFNFLKNEVDANTGSRKRSMQENRRLGWWAMLTAKIQENRVVQKQYFDLAEFFFKESFACIVEPGCHAHTYNHCAELSLLQNDTDRARILLKQSKDLFTELPDQDLQKQNEPYWLLIEMRISIALKNYERVLLQNDFPDICPSFLKGFLTTEYLRAALATKKFTIKDLEKIAVTAQSQICGQSDRPIFLLLGQIPWIEIIEMIPAPQQKKILTDAANILELFPSDADVLINWRESARHAAASGEPSGDILRNLKMGFLQLVPYNY